MSSFILTADNYHSPEANRLYKSCSQVKNFMSCEAKWWAEINREWQREETAALRHGSYIDLVLTEPEKVDKFLSDNYEDFFTQKGKEKQPKIDLDLAISRARKDKYFMSFLAGEHQEVIAIEDFHGHAFKCKLDVHYRPEEIGEKAREVDLKTCRGLDFENWHKMQDGKFKKVNWIYLYGYHIQRALYREAIKIKHSYYPLSYIAAIEKGKNPDIRIIKFEYSASEWKYILEKSIDSMDLMDKVASGEKDADRCDSCDYCKSTRRLSSTHKIEFDEKILLL